MPYASNRTPRYHRAVHRERFGPPCPATIGSPPAVALTALIALCGAASGCSGGSDPLIIVRWTHATAAAAAPAGIGAERRIIVMLGENDPSSGAGSLVTLEESNAQPIEGPFSIPTITDHPPVMVGTQVYAITKIGKFAAYDLAGQEKFNVSHAGGPSKTVDLAFAPDGTARIATTNGDLVALDPNSGAEQWMAKFESGINSPMSIAADGTTYLAAFSGRVEGFDASGVKTFDARTDALAAGPSATSDGVVVGDENSVTRFDKSGNVVFDHPRAAGVSGTQVLANGEILAWGMDGVLELLAADGSTIMSYTTAASNPPPIVTNAIAFANGKFGIIDNAGVAHLVNREGRAEVTKNLGTAPTARLQLGEFGNVIVTTGSQVQAVDFNAE